MESQHRHLGFAKRTHVRMPMLAVRWAWDCRPFGFGRVVAPKTSGVVEIAPGVHLSLKTGELRSEASAQRRSA